MSIEDLADLKGLLASLMNKVDSLVENQPPTVFTNRTLGEYLHLDQSTLAKLRGYGELSYVRVGKKILYTSDDVNCMQGKHIIPQNLNLIRFLS